MFVPLITVVWYVELKLTESPKYIQSDVSYSSVTAATPRASDCVHSFKSLGPVNHLIQNFFIAKHLLPAAQALLYIRGGTAVSLTGGVRAGDCWRQPEGAPSQACPATPPMGR